MKPESQDTVLLTLGRLPVALDIARAFSKAGWRVLVADPFAMHLTRMSNAVDRCFRVTAPSDDPARFLDDLATLIRRERVNLVIPVSEESLHVAALAGAGLDGVEIFCMPQHRMLELHDKYRFNRLAARLDLPVPDSCLADEDCSRITSHGPFVTKPRYSSSGRGVRIREAGSPVAADRDSVVQERLTGELLSSFSIARDGKPVATIVYRGAVMDGSVAVCFERVEGADEVEAWAGRFIEKTGHTGFIAFDFIVDDAGRAAAIECNPRLTSGVHFLEHAALPAAILGDPIRGALLRDDVLLTESYSCWTATLRSLFSTDGFKTNFGRLRDASDVTWTRRDPWPFVLMMVNTWRIVVGAIRTRQSFAQVAVSDIEWREPGSA